MRDHWDSETHRLYEHAFAVHKDREVEMDNISTTMEVDISELLRKSAEHRKSKMRITLRVPNSVMLVARLASWLSASLLRASSEDPTKSASRVSRPPGTLVLNVADFLVSPKTYERIYVEMVAEMQLEYFAALQQGRRWKARVARGRGYLAIAWTSLALLVRSPLGRIVRLLKMG